ncbi:hypothetical protein COW36_15640 [bacterium (Candidatus Blackallbacteria) CG17_big_fil_post_rev_8_21_14_2_50_48_46]|uniref:Type 4 fimbrial biogenesis protein PilX N-terminal domain-containing protein n=1 Tax=bacterium (Candidatus Blackallbacteria) CG17_big_fil_post_rev_8_21_14_2_50_48_46 TaxID=2014261 RepID=A0A2M7G284_9BACT|nr:MAG: hypothetical protein COW64_07595 [bacterium (Candidatus Blackallbacteria) CG18_big_fil_WC_8_21_14_2_50_49_26]PIW15901.1 MAG: hypothetical protein COW36_15640 [bacterium (Candidatus Blackallbacteria) CG17_big_fil_post_rev_8_21_14_2_50_48_46]PIW48634.1 MAG: hypothetical protein COW20_08530 [bacterium (Candidatus Blackallbacteria) CG13_big_fil_rev_8_21_14_2_50_49_14]
MLRPKKTREQGAALVMVLQLSVVGALMVGAIAYLVTSQNKYNLHSVRNERALWMAETGAQRFLSGLRNGDDCIDFSISTTNLNSSCTGYWLNTWIPIHDENNKTIGEYRVSLLPSTESKVKRVKSEGKVYDSKNGTVEINMSKRVIGVQFERFSLDNFAIASNHQLGGARINGGVRIYGGVFTAGRLGLDASSTGIYNDYHDLDTNQNFHGYPSPASPPQGEVYVYKDNISNPAPNPNGGIDLASQSDLGTNAAAFKAIHTDASVVDTGTPTGNPLPSTVGDSIVGDGQDTQVHANKIDHELPNVNFPDASVNSQFMTDRLVEATTNGCVRGSSGAPSNLVLGNASIANPAGAGCGSKFTYTVTGSGNNQVRLLHIEGAVFIYGSISAAEGIKYTGKGAIFATGNATFSEGLEPSVPTDYPNNAALGVVTSGDMALGQGSGSDTKYVGSFFANQQATINKSKIFGNIFAGRLEIPDTGTRPDIYVHPDVREQVGVPMPDFTNVKVSKTAWWEMYGDAAK